MHLKNDTKFIRFSSLLSKANQNITIHTHTWAWVYISDMVVLFVIDLLILFRSIWFDDWVGGAGEGAGVSSSCCCSFFLLFFHSSNISLDGHQLKAIPTYLVLVIFFPYSFSLFLFFYLPFSFRYDKTTNNRCGDTHIQRIHDKWSKLRAHGKSTRRPMESTNKKKQQPLQQHWNKWTICTILFVFVLVYWVHSNTNSNERKNSTNPQFGRFHLYTVWKGTRHRL